MNMQSAENYPLQQLLARNSAPADAHGLLPAPAQRGLNNELQAYSLVK